MQGVDIRLSLQMSCGDVMCHAVQEPEPRVPPSSFLPMSPHSSGGELGASWLLGRTFALVYELGFSHCCGAGVAGRLDFTHSGEAPEYQGTGY